MAKKSKAVFTRKVPKKGFKQGIDKASGKKVFAKEYKLGKEKGKAARGSAKLAGTVAAMQKKLALMDAGKLKGKAGQRSVMRGFLAAAGAQSRKSAKDASTSGS